MSNYNPKQVLAANTKAIKLILENTTGKYSPVEVEILKQYKGFGGLKAVMFGDGPLKDWKDASKSDRELYIGFQELYKILDDNLTGKEYRAALDSMKNGVLTQFFTPAIVPKTFYEVIQKHMQIEWMYEPSAGSGIFITELEKLKDRSWFVQACEKDILTSRILKGITSSMELPVSVYSGGFEDSNTSDDGEYNLVCTNPPYGAIPVYDSKCQDKNHYSKLHNYFFWKGLTKLREGGILAYLITSAYLDTVSNKSAREYLFMNSDFISLTVMPDNLMKDSAGTEAGSHFLVVRKRSGKTEMSEEEKLLCISERDTEKTAIGLSRNLYIRNNYKEITIGETKIGKNQYGQPSMEVWWDKPMDQTVSEFLAILERDMKLRYKVPEPVPKILPWDNRKLPEELPIDKIVITEPNKFIWIDGTEVQKKDICKICKVEYLEPEDEYTCKKCISKLSPWLSTDTTVDEEVDPLDEVWLGEDSTCLTDEEETARLKDMANMEMGEGRYADEPEDSIADKHGIARFNLSADTPVVQMELIPDPQKGWSKRDRQVHEAYIQIRDTLNALEEAEQNQ